MKKIIFSMFLLLFPFMIVNANTISNIDMDIYIDSNGDANITETWVANVNNGTEGWHPYYNLGNSKITDLKVKMDDSEFETVDSWNENSSMSDKAYKTGFYYPNDNELDICFGVTEYGSHTYEIKYKITGFVTKATDADIVYWQLFPYDFSATPNKVYIKIYSDFEYSKDLDIWGYGNYGGTAYVYDGYIEVSSPDGLTSDQYMTVLIKFPSNTFSTSNMSNKSFDDYFSMAKKGATRYKEKKSFDLTSIIVNFAVYGIILLGIFIVIFKGANKNGVYRFGETGNKVRKDAPNFREIPCNKDIFRAYFVSSIYNINKKKEDFLGAILLKWLRNGNVKVEKVDKKGLFKTNVSDNIIFLNKPTQIDLETTLYEWMVEASKDGKLESNEFKKWCSSNYSKILKWFEDVIDYERDLLIQEGKIKKSTETKAKIFTADYYDVDSSMMNEAEQLYGLKKFLKEFTVIKQREPIEVALWDEYLIFAQVFGIADEVAKQFKKLYPEITENMNQSGFDYSDMVFLYAISNTGMNSANTARSRAQAYNAGGGGFSSGGGGGGSFGGGGGGGGFR